MRTMELDPSRHKIFQQPANNINNMSDENQITEGESMLGLNKKPTLDELCVKYGTDKQFSQHDFSTKYEFFFEKMRNDKFSIFEIGVCEGASHKVWKEYFPHATTYGIDINPNCKQYQEDRIHIEIGSQIDQSFLEEFIKNMPNLRIIIDDGSHIIPHQYMTFELLFPKLEEGGFYCIEDTHTSYSKNPIYDNSKFNIFGILFALNAQMNLNGKNCNDAWFANKKTHYDSFKHLYPELGYHEKYVKAIHLYKGLAIIEKDHKWWE